MEQKWWTICNLRKNWTVKQENRPGVVNSSSGDQTHQRLPHHKLDKTLWKWKTCMPGMNLYEHLAWGKKKFHSDKEKKKKKELILLPSAAAYC